ncbi:MAG TPA: hypothetical protein VEZ11_06830 [Thermoanaerobaculia bacterium]|nr:hypothetical protein [Thermoanaerobaculia bacterium]
MRAVIRKPESKEQLRKDPPQLINRGEIIRLLKEEFRRMSTDDDTSICKLAAEKGVFCRGFHRFNDDELRKRYDWLVRRDPTMSREDLEDLGNRWQIARQEVEEADCSCDVQARVHDTCRGWDDFSNEELAGFFLEITGKKLNVS